MLLLQAFPSNAAADSALFGAFVLIIIAAIIIQVLIIRWVFRIDTQVNNQRATTWFLIKLCEKQGITKEEIDKIRKDFKIK